MGFHEIQGVCGEEGWGDGAGVGVHDFCGGVMEGLRAFSFEEAAEVAVGEDA